MSYSVKSVKTFVGREGGGFNATLLRDGKPVAMVIDDASGGPVNVQWLDFSAKKVAVDWIDYKDEPIKFNATPEEAKVYDEIRGKTVAYDFGKGNKGTMKVSLDLFVGKLVEDFMNAKKLKALCNKKTVVHWVGDPKGEYRTFKAPFDATFKAMIVAKWGKQIDEFVNETIGQVAK